MLTTHLHPDRGVATLISGRDAAPSTWFGSEKELNRFLHSPASRFLSLCSIDVVHVVALNTVQERHEEFRSLGTNVECIRQNLGYHYGTGSSFKVKVTSIASPPRRPVSLRAAALTLTKC
jgi:hypothetical protein